MSVHHRWLQRNVTHTKKKNCYKKTLKIIRIHPVLRYVIRTLVLPRRKAAEITAQMAERVVRAYASAAADSGLIRVGSNQ